MIIYLVTNKINGRMYIGQTVKDLDHRKKQHINNALKGNSDNNYLHNAIIKYRQNNFTWVILHDNITDINLLNRLEIFYIGYYNTFNDGYNLTAGGGGSLGRITSQKTRNKIKKSLLGFKHSVQTRKNMSKAVKGVKHPMYGKHHSEKSKRKMSKSRKGKYKLGKHPRARAVVVCGHSFDTVTEAAIYLKIPRGTLTNRLRHPTDLCHYKYVRDDA